METDNNDNDQIIKSLQLKYEQIYDDLINLELKTNKNLTQEHLRQYKEYLHILTFDINYRYNKLIIIEYYQRKINLLQEEYDNIISENLSKLCL